MSFTAMKIEYKGNTYFQGKDGIITLNGVKVTWGLSEKVRVWPEITSSSEEEDDEEECGTNTTTMCSFGSAPSSDGYGSELNHYNDSDGEYNQEDS